MKNKLNIYITLSAVWFGTCFLLALLDDERMLVDDNVFLSILLASLMNMVYSIYLYVEPTDNYYQD